MIHLALWIASCIFLIGCALAGIAIVWGMIELIIKKDKEATKEFPPQRIPPYVSHRYYPPIQNPKAGYSKEERN